MEFCKWGKTYNSLTQERLIDTKKRSVAKAVSWSIIGAILTITIAYALTIPIKTSILIGVIEIFTRLIFYFFHERIWNNIKWGKRH